MVGRSLLIIVVALGVNLSRPQSAVALAGPCSSSGQGNYFNGPQSDVNVYRGVQARIEYKNPWLCITSGNPYKSGTSSWVAVTNPSFSGNIYQVGFYRCQMSACPVGVNYVVAYGRQAGACGSTPLPPAAIPLGTAAASTVEYRIQRSYQPGRGWIYAAYVNGYEKDWRSQGALEVCWTGGPKQYKFHNEVFNTADYNPGLTANHQTWDTMKYQNSADAWVSTPYFTCQNPLSTQECVYNSATSFDTWDNRP